MTCFLINDALIPGDVISNSMPDRVASKHKNWTDTGEGFDGPSDTSNFARSDPSPESSEDREMEAMDQDAVRVDGFLNREHNEELQ